MVKAARATGHYDNFDQLDGSHPWRNDVPEGVLLYPVRRLSKGRVSYFNFALAKEMGLIDADHPNTMNVKLEEKLLETFSLRIINEYDQQAKTRFASESVKPNTFMATRYLQLQHPDKSGRTSGDGRCIWNGVYTNGKKSWDVSSRGTGVTALAPGAVLAGKPLESGNRDFGYGCGLAEIDELLGAALTAEIFHRNGHATERVLAIIDLGKGVGIGVRAGSNLLRPAHLILFLKQGRLAPLKKAVDAFLLRQKQNGEWNIPLGKPTTYNLLLEALCENFARFFAYLDRDYIFAWLDWDGDNVLASGGIIDYGSVRQFGLRHDQYRYDDIERFSTNLSEQKKKARLLVQVFCQMVDFLETGSKKSLAHFRNSPVLIQFDDRFEHHLHDRFLYQLGFEPSLRRLLLNRHGGAVSALFDVHFECERIKTHRKIRRVADGVHRPAIFNMRRAMAEMPQYLLANGLRPADPKTFFGWILSSQAKGRDRRRTSAHERRIELWQKQYIALLQKVSASQNISKLLENVAARAEMINREDRMTGNALINIVDELLRYRRRNSDPKIIQAVVDEFIDHQTLNPDFTDWTIDANDAAPPSLLRTLLTVTYDSREDI